MRGILFFDQVQAGKGGKENDLVPLTVEKGGVGSYSMFERHAKDAGISIAATIYCGYQTFEDDKEAILEKITKLLGKVNADVLICGPTYDFKEYTDMACAVAQYVEQNSSCKSIVCSAPEKNQATIDAYKENVTIVKMPKKGGVGLSDALKIMVNVADAKGKGDPLTPFEASIY